MLRNDMWKSDVPIHPSMKMARTPLTYEYVIRFKWNNFISFGTSSWTKRSFVKRRSREIEEIVEFYSRKTNRRNGCSILANACCLYSKLLLALLGFRSLALDSFIRLLEGNKNGKEALKNCLKKRWELEEDVKKRSYLMSR